VNFTLTTLGTASARPTVGNHHSAHVVNLHGRLFLIDCGEGTQSQLTRFGISTAHLDNILISHLHGDHVFGIFGLLSTMGLNGRTAPVYIYAPRDFGSVLKFFLSHFGEGIKYEINHIPLKMKEPEKLVDFRNCELWAFPLHHRIDTFGFKIVYHRKPRHPQEREIYKSFAYCSDTVPFPQEADWVRGVDLLFHESTFDDSTADKAEQMVHSTARSAAGVAAAGGVGKMVIGHFSSRIKDLGSLLAQAREVFPETYLAEEGKIFEI